MDEDRTADSAFLSNAIEAISKEFDSRLKLDRDFKQFAETLEEVHRMTEEFIRPRAHLLAELDEEEE